MAEIVGFVGLGVMGGAMARRLLDAGHQLLVWTRTAAHSEPLAAAGAEVVDGPETIARRCDVVVSCLLNSDVVEEVYLGRGGLLSSGRRGQILVEHGTFSPALARELAALASQGAGAFLDVPVTGGPEGARAGRLVAMAGGSAAALDRVRPILDAYTREVVYVGESGAGLELKLVNQLLVSAHVAAAAEAAALLRALGLGTDDVVRALTGGWASSAMLERCLVPALGGPPAPAGAQIGGLRASHPLIAELEAHAGLELSVFRSASRLMTVAVDRQLGDRDIAMLVDALDSEKGSGSGEAD